MPPSRTERKLYVSSLNKAWNEQDLRDLFKAYGNVEDVNILKDSTGASKGSAFVIFANKSSAYAAIKALNQKKPLEVSGLIKHAVNFNLVRCANGFARFCGTRSIRAFGFR